MKLPDSTLRRRSALEIQMTPMIDVVFLLLVFFVWTASFQIEERWLPGSVTAPTTAATGGTTNTDVPPPPEADFEQVIIRIQWQDDAPRWAINDLSIGSLEDVRERLSRIAAIRAAAPIVLHPDSSVPLGHVIDVYDVARLAGFTQVSFAAAQPKPNPFAPGAVRSPP